MLSEICIAASSAATFGEGRGCGPKDDWAADVNFARGAEESTG